MKSNIKTLLVCLIMPVVLAGCESLWLQELMGTRPCAEYRHFKVQRCDSPDKYGYAWCRPVMESECVRYLSPEELTAEEESPASLVSGYGGWTFTYVVKLPPGWQRTQYRSNAEAAIQPRKDFKVFADLVVMVMLGKEGGNTARTLDEYWPVLVEQMKKRGFPIETLKPFHGLRVPAGWRMWTISRADRKVRELLVLRQEDGVILIHDFAFHEKFEELLARYKADMEYIVANARYTREQLKRHQR